MSNQPPSKDFPLPQSPPQNNSTHPNSPHDPPQRPTTNPPKSPDHSSQTSPTEPTALRDDRNPSASIRHFLLGPLYLPFDPEPFQCSPEEPPISAPLPQARPEVATSTETQDRTLGGSEDGTFGVPMHRLGAVQEQNRARLERLQMDGDDDGMSGERAQRSSDDGEGIAADVRPSEERDRSGNEGQAGAVSEEERGENRREPDGGGDRDYERIIEEIVRSYSER